MYNSRNEKYVSFDILFVGLLSCKDEKETWIFWERMQLYKGSIK